MIEVREKSGFFSDNGGWIRPLAAAFILLIAPKLMQTFGGSSSGFLIPLCSIIALIAVVYAGIRARMAETLLAKVVSHLAVLVCLLMVAVQLFHLVLFAS
jgi:hypothetical protein